MKDESDPEPSETTRSSSSTASCSTAARVRLDARICATSTAGQPLSSYSHCLT
jgi:hypothetical protein